MSSEISTKGWNWGHYKLKEDELEFKVDNRRCFAIKYKDIALSSASGKNEVAFEFA
jgi:structure-specific recognition protein 1